MGFISTKSKDETTTPAMTAVSLVPSIDDEVTVQETRPNVLAKADDAIIATVVLSELAHPVNEHQPFQWDQTEAPAIRTFDTGATRDQDGNKLDFEGFLSPLVIERYAEYMHHHRRQTDGSLRDSDNWQKGIPLAAYMKSAWRHFRDWWQEHRGLQSGAGYGIEDALCALLFNTMGYLHELLKRRAYLAKETK